MLVGGGHSGKTTTLHSLMGDDFREDKARVIGTDKLDRSVVVTSMDICNWQPLTHDISEFVRTLSYTALQRTIDQQQQLKEQVQPAEGHGMQDDKPRPSFSLSLKHERSHHTSTTQASRCCPTASTEEIEKAIKGMNIYLPIEASKPGVTFKVFDLGGQSTFHIFYPFFFTKYAVYLLVFSMEDLLHQDESKRAEAWEFMEHWLSSLHLHAKGAPILIVGTFADKINERKQHEGISRDIYSRLRHNPAFPGVIHNDKHGLWFWPVDNTKSIRDPMIQDLRQTISSTALAQEYVSQEVAVPYLHLYDKLNAIARDEKRPLLTFDEVVQIARTCGLPTCEETRACLQFLHLYSMVLYYDHVPGMEDYVILSPQWAVDTMTRVIRNFDLHRDVRDGEARAVGAQVWDDLVDRGILHRRLLDVLWKELGGDMIEPFICLMKHYGLCMEYTTPTVQLPSHQQQHQHHQQYLVPAVLPMTIRHNTSTVASVSLSTTAAQQVNPYVGYEEKTAFIAFSLKPFKRSASVRVEDAQQASFLPEALFTVVLAHVMAHAQHGASQAPKLSRTHAICFMESTKLELQLVPAVGGIKMKITSAQPRAMLHMLHTMISEAARERYPELKSSLLVPFDAKTLLFFEDVLHHHKSKQDMWVHEQLLSPDDLITKYDPLLPVLGLQDKYDVFISYRLEEVFALLSAIANLQGAQNRLKVRADACDILPTPLLRRTTLNALAQSTVVCPVISVSSIEQIVKDCHDGKPSELLLEWTAILSMKDLVRGDDSAAAQKLRLRTVIPIIVAAPSHRSDDAAVPASHEIVVVMQRAAAQLPDTSHDPTMTTLTSEWNVGVQLPSNLPTPHVVVTELMGRAEAAAVPVLQSQHDDFATNIERYLLIIMDSVQEHGQSECDIDAPVDMTIQDLIRGLTDTVPEDDPLGLPFFHADSRLKCLLECAERSLGPDKEVCTRIRQRQQILAQLDGQAGSSSAEDQSAHGLPGFVPRVPLLSCFLLLALFFVFGYGELWDLSPGDIVKLASACGFRGRNLSGPDLIYKLESHVPENESYPYLSPKSTMQTLLEIAQDSLGVEGAEPRLCLLLIRWQEVSGLRPQPRAEPEVVVNPPRLEPRQPAAHQPPQAASAEVPPQPQRQVVEQAEEDTSQTSPLHTAPPQQLLEFIENEIVNLESQDRAKLANECRLDSTLKPAELVHKLKTTRIGRYPILSGDGDMDPLLAAVERALPRDHLLEKLIQLWQVAADKKPGDRDELATALLTQFCPFQVPAETAPPVVIVCAKPYEFEAMNRALARLADVRRHPSSIGHNFESGYRGEERLPFNRYDFIMRKRGKSIPITVSRFTAKLQGPVECGIHAGQVITTLKPSHMGMIGVCGGHRLGDIIIATEAKDARAGRMVISADDALESVDPVAYDPDFQGYLQRYVFKRAKRHEVTSTWTGSGVVADHLANTFHPTSSANVHKESVLHTYPQVREDCAGLVQLDEGLDMEAFPFFKAIHMANDSKAYDITALPVMKAVSDTSVLALGEGSDAALQERQDTNDSVFCQALGLDLAEFKRQKQTAQQDPKLHEKRRRRFRTIAAAKAAAVMADFLDQAPFLRK
ncbi:hypothetical protein PTSG_02681 [Salpingoeca rosetta]|uniref:COR domain-containing protein n=1 Tax=Salpingoeca rosetta (strain ATCC 50818 / BSB-021) TaxID=946362 RepID=F2U300_SALR5|nr:uncharacterized protein PTSG_02681 [Salpingoeca rosetta]EGD81994.1 hypothetical protein PTSG_02681 [Salpingoeca rosetta]|eukprot:XP_004996177.1 hypothetical protein PTSG_02681 [Salpingoeca rosetta]